MGSRSKIEISPENFFSLNSLLIFKKPKSIPNNIAIETASEIVKKIFGTEVNASSVSAIVEDISKKQITKHI